MYSGGGYGYPPAPMGAYPGTPGMGYMNGPGMNPMAPNAYAYSGGYQDGCLRACAACLCIELCCCCCL